VLIEIPAVLAAEQVIACRTALARADWGDGRDSTGYLGAAVKANRQTRPGDPIALHWGDVILAALETSPRFMSAALPLKVTPPCFNDYRGGGHYGGHVDGAIHPIAGTPHRVRTDLSMTLFLSDPADYDGGELVIHDDYGAHSVKLPAGHLILYPSSSLHQVLPVTRGARLAAFGWVQSMVRDLAARTLLFELDNAIQQAGGLPGSGETVLRLTHIYHNLLRRWTDV
jgi:PKHD-type hydroxylase